MRLRLPRFDRTTVTVTAAVVLLAIAYAGLISLADRVYRTESTIPSMTNDGPAGLSVYFRYLDGLGYAPKALRAFDDLPDGATIVAAAPFQVLPTEAEKVRLAKWVRAGGRLVAVGTGAGLLLDGLDLTGAASLGATDALLPARVPTVYAAGVRTVAPGPDRLAASAPEWVAHYADRTGAVLLSAAVGDGEVVWLAAADVVANGAIGEADNSRLAVLLTAAGKGAVYFDEYHLGFKDDSSLWTLLGSGGQAAALLAAFALIAMLAARGRRLGTALAPREEPSARTAAYISSLAELYRKAGARSESLESLEDGLARALARRHGTVEAGLTQRPQAREALERSRALRREASPGREEFMAAARLIRRARQEIEGRHG
ncbi:MAG: hypothetical protein Q7W16_08670 [Coriobacteriia bacterium]|nr:hypothetical protein [Coriobacteriia bacterium]